MIGVVYAKSTDASLLVPVSTLRSMLEDTSSFATLPPARSLGT
ncbi:hypothetical protein NKG05_00045 [Oerskovia sp. M15]